MRAFFAKKNHLSAFLAKKDHMRAFFAKKSTQVHFWQKKVHISAFFATKKIHLSASIWACSCSNSGLSSLLARPVRLSVKTDSVSEKELEKKSQFDNIILCLPRISPREMPENCGADIRPIWVQISGLGSLGLALDYTC